MCAMKGGVGGQGREGGMGTWLAFAKTGRSGRSCFSMQQHLCACDRLACCCCCELAAALAHVLYSSLTSWLSALLPRLARRDTVRNHVRGPGECIVCLRSHCALNLQRRKEVLRAVVIVPSAQGGVWCVRATGGKRAVSMCWSIAVLARS